MASQKNKLIASTATALLGLSVSMTPHVTLDLITNDIRNEIWRIDRELNSPIRVESPRLDSYLDENFTWNSTIPQDVLRNRVTTLIERKQELNTQYSEKAKGFRPYSLAGLVAGMTLFTIGLVSGSYFLLKSK